MPELLPTLSVEPAAVGAGWITNSIEDLQYRVTGWYLPTMPSVVALCDDLVWCQARRRYPYCWLVDYR